MTSSLRAKLPTTQRSSRHLEQTVAENTRLSEGSTLSVKPTPKWWAWLPATFWLGIIAIESSSLFSSANTGEWLYPIFHLLFKIDAAHFEHLHAILRKTGHFVGY